ncbi:MAG TPA: hypothetical protein VFK22_00130 [Candidatus Dormibacteraeota bacterium]|nr:hypothetical protein [Candidatus Dormibacteraeota bacterium]
MTFSCRLPVLITSQFNDGVTMAGGFVTFPAAVYQSDPNGGIISTPTGDFATNAQPTLHGSPQTGSPFYDLAPRRWLPVAPGQTSDDGSTYVYAEGGASTTDPTALHVVTVATGVDRVVMVTPPPEGAAVGWQIGDFDGRYAYLLGDQFERYPAGVWRVDTTTGALTQITSAGSILLLKGSDLWVGAVNPADPSPPLPPRSGQEFDSIVHIDLGTGTQTTWIYRPGQSIAVRGVDVTGHPVVNVASGPDFDTSLGAVYLLTNPGAPGTQILSGGLRFLQMQPDVGRIWFGNDRGVYVWTLASGLQKVFVVPPNTQALSQTIYPAGHCV